MKESDKCSMLEAMEQQSLSIAKAGMVCKLKTECSVLAACNPKGSYDSEQPLTVNIALPSPLLSRFDIVLLMLDSPNEEWDRLASNFLLQGKDLMRKNSQEKPVWDFDKLKLYLNYVKGLKPELTEGANTVLQKYYQLQRKSDDRNAARTTVRMLESIIRLSQAHAKLMLRDKVLIMDAVVVITLLECSLNKAASFNNVNILHTSFPLDSEIEYQNQIYIILNKLNLRDLYVEEMLRIVKEYEPFCDDNQCINFTQHTREDVFNKKNNFEVVKQLTQQAVPTQQEALNFKKKLQTQRSSIYLNKIVEEEDEDEKEQEEEEEEEKECPNKNNLVENKKRQRESILDIIKEDKQSDFSFKKPKIDESFSIQKAALSQQPSQVITNSQTDSLRKLSQKIKASVPSDDLDDKDYEIDI